MNPTQNKNLKCTMRQSQLDHRTPKTRKSQKQLQISKAVSKQSLQGCGETRRSEAPLVGV